MTEQASFWEQSDLLALIPPAGPAADQPLPPAAEPSPSPSPSLQTRPAPADPQSPVLSLEPPPLDAADADAEAAAAPAVRAHTVSAKESAAALMPSEPGPATVSASMPAASTAAVVSLPPLASAPGRPLPSCPERLLVLDTETTALSVEHGQCIEVGAVLFHVPTRAVLLQVSFLLPCPSNPAEAINGIPAPVSRLSQPWQAGLACFEAMVAAADALVAHNVAFDRQWFGQAPLPTLSKPWICSMEDIRWPADRQLRATPSVRDLALAYGIPVWAAHRALTDCIYLVQVFERCSQLELLLQAALEPRRLYRAQIGYAERHRAKEAGFRWNEPVRGAWSRRLSDREVEALAFAVEPVDSLAGVLPRTA